MKCQAGRNEPRIERLFRLVTTDSEPLMICEIQLDCCKIVSVICLPRYSPTLLRTDGRAFNSIQFFFFFFDFDCQNNSSGSEALISQSKVSGLFGTKIAIITGQLRFPFLDFLDERDSCSRVCSPLLLLLLNQCLLRGGETQPLVGSPFTLAAEPNKISTCIGIGYLCVQLRDRNIGKKLCR